MRNNPTETIYRTNGLSLRNISFFVGQSYLLFLCIEGMSLEPSWVLGFGCFFMSILALCFFELAFFLVDFDVDKKFLYINPKPFGLLRKKIRVTKSDIDKIYVTTEIATSSKGFKSNVHFVKVKMRNSKRLRLIYPKSLIEAHVIKKAISRNRY